MAMEQKFRGLLEESLEDAIFLSAANSQLKLLIQDLKQGICEYLHTHVIAKIMSREPDRPSHSTTLGADDAIHPVMQNGRVWLTRLGNCVYNNIIMCMDIIRGQKVN